MGENGAKYIGEKLGGKGKAALSVFQATAKYLQNVNGFKDVIAKKTIRISK